MRKGCTLMECVVMSDLYTFACSRQGSLVSLCAGLIQPCEPRLEHTAHVASASSIEEDASSSILHQIRSSLTNHCHIVETRRPAPIYSLLSTSQGNM